MKSGQARILSDSAFLHVIDEVSKRRYPEKNKAILHVSFKLGLRCQEIALLRIKEVAKLHSTDGITSSFTLNEILALPANITKGANATRNSSAKNIQRIISFSVKDFDQVVERIIEKTKLGHTIDPKEFYPPPRKSKGRSRDIPMVDHSLREALTDFLKIRLENCPNVKGTDPLFITQQGKAYKPHSLQEHISLMLSEWGGIERASSHSGRRTILTKLIKETRDLKVAQKLAGHKDPATTLIYAEADEQDIAGALQSVAFT